MSQSDENWDIESCFNPLEPPEHWILKKAFLKKHYDKFPRQKLLALANTFYNMEFLGARYDSRVETQASLLAEDVSEITDYRNGRRNALKRTFVSATDATRNKIQKTQLNIPVVQQPLRLSCNSDLIEKVRNQPGFDGKMILFENEITKNQPYQIIIESAQRAQLAWELKRTGKQRGELSEFQLIIDNNVIVSDYVENEKKAKISIGVKAFEMLKETCFMISVKSQLEGESLTKSDTTKTENKTDALPSDNKGAKMMRLMGWKGQGLGKNSDGIEKPIQVTENISRLGLNLGIDQGYRNLREKTTNLLESYIKTFSTHNIVFSNEFSNEERKIVHGIAQKLKLKSKSYGKDTNRQLVVCRKLTSWELVEHLLQNNCKTPNYELMKPNKFQQ